ncbi:MAG: hypothetical protein U1C74_21250 [Phenylobacterium sp.]|nr:hypothetical protein [Phenylobacterium sp.]
MRPAALKPVAPILAALAVLSAPAGPALAQSAGDTADVRCLMVLQVVGNDPKQAEQAARGVYFYLGRLTARGPATRIEGLVRAEAARLPAQQAQAELKRCGAELNARTQEYQAVNKRLAASARPPAKK